MVVGGRVVGSIVVGATVLVVLVEVVRSVNAVVEGVEGLVAALEVVSKSAAIVVDVVVVDRVSQLKHERNIRIYSFIEFIHVKISYSLTLVILGFRRIHLRNKRKGT